MSTFWSAGEYWGARIALVAVEAASCAVYVLVEEGRCTSVECVLTPGERLAMVAGVPLVVHLGLLLSFAAERGGLGMRLFGMLLLIPSSLLAITLVRVSMLNESQADAFFIAAVLSYALVHVVQFWALLGIPFPRLPPLAPLAPETNRGG